MSLRKKIVWLPYDFDTALGINNEGALVFDYELEDTDHIEGGADVFNGQESVLWNNIRDAFGDELASMYQTLRSQGKLSYSAVEQAFEDHQDKWPEAIFNEDAWFKYIDPLINDGNGAYLEMMQGSKKEQRKWWLYNRFRYIDSKYNAGDALSDVIQLRGYAKANITVIPYADIYPTVKYGSYLVHERGKRGVATTLLNPLDNVNDTEIYIYSSSQLASVGDLSGLLVGFADFSMATKLQSLKIGSDATGYSNTNLKTLTLGNNVLLKTIDVRNCVGLGTGDQKAVDISGCTNIEEIYFDGTNITGLQLPNGGIIKKLHLPATVTNLTIMNQKSITEFVMPSYANITTLRLENVSTAIDMFDILDAIQDNSRIRLIGFYIEAQNAQEISELFDIFDKMRGLDEQGNNTEKAQVSGEIHTASLTGAEIAEFNSRYSYVRVTADHTSAILTYKTYDGASVLFTETVLDGGNGTKVNSTARISDAQYSYTPDGWATEANGNKNANALVNVLADRTVFAAYTKTLRKYTVTFVRASVDGGGTLQTISNVNYGTSITASSVYTGATPTTTQGSAEDYPFEGWNPASATVQGDTVFTAKFGSPIDVSEITDSWDTIIANIDNGTYKTAYKVGQYKPLDLGTEGTINMQIVAMDADELASGGYAPLTFIGMELLKYTIASNLTGNSLTTKLKTDILPLFPSSVAKRVQKVRKGYWYNDNFTYTDRWAKLWIPSAYAELGGLDISETILTNPSYASVYKDDKSREKQYNSLTANYLLRDGAYPNRYYVRTWGEVKKLNSSSIEHYRLCFGFCLGEYNPSFESTSIDVTDAYAVQWDYSQDQPKLARGGLASSFADPQPATSNSGTGTSPFDNVLPWSGMKRYNVIDGQISYSEDDAEFDETLYDTVVYIPEFYYAVEKDTTNQRWTWSISPVAKTGYAKHPASGRYVGRFHTSGDANGVFTKSGVMPLVSTTQTDFRTYSHNKGAKWYMMDFATWSAIQMLYLVEYAHFNSQDKLGKGWNTGSVGQMGGTTGAAYHTIKATGAHNQYRWIEDPFSNVLDNIDGFVASAKAVYTGVSDTGYAGDTSDLTETGITLPSSGFATGLGYSANAPWAFIPDTASGGSSTTYLTDRANSNTGVRVARVGCDYYGDVYSGMFYLTASNNASSANDHFGSRLIYIP